MCVTMYAVCLSHGPDWPAVLGMRRGVHCNNINCLTHTHTHTHTEYVTNKYTVAKTSLVDAINDKCANCRRKDKSSS